MRNMKKLLWLNFCTEFNLISLLEVVRSLCSGDEMSNKGPEVVKERGEEDLS